MIIINIIGLLLASVVMGLVAVFSLLSPAGRQRVVGAVDRAAGSPRGRRMGGAVSGYVRTRPEPKPEPEPDQPAEERPWAMSSTEGARARARERRRRQGEAEERFRREHARRAEAERAAAQVRRAEERHQTADAGQGAATTGAAAPASTTRKEAPVSTQTAEYAGIADVISSLEARLTELEATQADIQDRRAEVEAEVDSMTTLMKDLAAISEMVPESKVGRELHAKLSELGAGGDKAEIVAQLTAEREVLVLAEQEVARQVEAVQAALADSKSFQASYEGAVRTDATSFQTNANA